MFLHTRLTFVMSNRWKRRERGYAASSLPRRWCGWTSGRTAWRSPHTSWWRARRRPTAWRPSSAVRCAWSAGTTRTHTSPSGRLSSVRNGVVANQAANLMANASFRWYLAFLICSLVDGSDMSRSHSWPALSDIDTQHSYQMMDSCFAGLIFSVYPKAQVSVALICLWMVKTKKSL